MSILTVIDLAIIVYLAVRAVEQGAAEAIKAFRNLWLNRVGLPEQFILDPDLQHLGIPRIQRERINIDMRSSRPRRIGNWVEKNGITLLTEFGGRRQWTRCTWRDQIRGTCRTARDADASAGVTGCLDSAGSACIAELGSV